MGSIQQKTTSHPLDPLSGDEIIHACRLVRQAQPYAKLAFKAALLLEPPKEVLQPYLKAELHKTALPPTPERVAEVIAILLEEPFGIQEHHVSLTQSKVIHTHVPPKDQHVNMDVEEMTLYEDLLFEDPLFLQEVKKMKLPENAVLVADPWIYGADSVKPQKRMVHFLCYMRNPKNNDVNSNHYAWPLPIVPVMETDTRKVIRVDWAYTGDEKDAMNQTYDKENTMGHVEGSEYEPVLRTESERQGLKPLHVSQPEGPSFTVDGHLIQWQDWRFRIGFNFREGLTLHDVSFKGRQLFYRLSFSDMTVPYGDPRPPLHRKQAFDLGDVGAGTTANCLKLGCDCLGVIKYFSGFAVNRAGEAVHQENVICMHEQDDGLLWKHTNYRTNKAVAVRSRVLILQTILTVSNYEYIINWKFDQAGALHLELRATGILSTQHIDADKTSPYGTIVSPGVLAANHQHIFSIRVDPSLDGGKNSIVYDDTQPMPFESDEDKKVNPYGVGFVNKRTFIEKEGYADLDPFKNRVFKIINENQINRISKTPVAYKMHIPATRPILAHPESIAYKRADFADHHVYVVKDRPNQLFSGGRYTNQSYGTHYGLKDWIKGKENVRNANPVCFLNFGLTHSTRVEDFPVMPCETMTLSFKPFNFFESNPSNDLPASSQTENQSARAEDVAPACCT